MELRRCCIFVGPEVHAVQVMRRLLRSCRKPRTKPLPASGTRAPQQLQGSHSRCAQIRPYLWSLRPGSGERQTRLQQIRCCPALQCGLKQSAGDLVRMPPDCRPCATRAWPALLYCPEGSQACDPKQVHSRPFPHMLNLSALSPLSRQMCTQFWISGPYVHVAFQACDRCNRMREHISCIRVMAHPMLLFPTPQAVGQPAVACSQTSELPWALLACKVFYSWNAGTPAASASGQRAAGRGPHRHLPHCLAAAGHPRGPTCRGCRYVLLTRLTLGHHCRREYVK